MFACVASSFSKFPANFSELVKKEGGYHISLDLHPYSFPLILFLAKSTLLKPLGSLSRLRSLQGVQAVEEPLHLQNE